jgi:AAA ATPase-like protein
MCLLGGGGLRPAVSRYRPRKPCAKCRTARCADVSVRTGRPSDALRRPVRHHHYAVITMPSPNLGGGPGRTRAVAQTGCTNATPSSDAASALAGPDVAQSRAPCRPIRGSALVAESGTSRLRLLGRSTECATIDELVADARGGRSRVAVLRGEAGAGKSALLDYLSHRVVGGTLRLPWASSPRWSLPTAACTSSARRCWISSSGYRARSATRFRPCSD